MKQIAGYRTTFFKELPDSAGHCWYVPVWSKLLSADDHNSALELAIGEFERAHANESWSENATIIEIDEALVDGTNAESLPPAKRVVRAHKTD